ncbi:hypothetical protein CO615_08070 [Lysobacteraceae bacterium NML75-0749]|nr:hypothetical protein CO615_08070 [Xanthomonadaceae bacterium NML75-0749]PJK03361.1 hypothetical protein CO612_09125 [Xanthomonadaceae bacterium NML71-0210]PJK05741.1 hypothetical protein CO609_01960 [Xanthomonadaceae bacterium NML91-0268]
MKHDLHTVDEWRQACHLYFSLAREVLHHVDSGSLVLSEWTSRSRARDIHDLLKALEHAVARAPFDSTEGEA